MEIVHQLDSRWNTFQNVSFTSVIIHKTNKHNKHIPLLDNNKTISFWK
jgi:hypothetical protein